MASTGQVEPAGSATKGSHQPIGRPVMGMTTRPAAFRSASACSASGVMAPSVVRVSSMSVKTPTKSRWAAGGQRLKGNMRV